MFKKRGQVSIFILIGVVVLFILFFAISSGSNKIFGRPFDFDYDVVAVNNYVVGCLERSSENVLWDLGLEGIYEEESEISRYKGRRVSVYNSNPPISEVKLKINTWILNEFDKCFDRQFLEKQGYTIELNESKSVDVSISEKDIVIHLNFPFKISKSGREKSFSEFISTMDVGFGFLYSRADLLIEEVKKNPNYNLSNYCGFYDSNSFINIIVGGSGDEQIISFIDYSYLDTKYSKSYVYRFSLRGTNIEGECVG